ncbi:hypothetical protein [Ferrovibrio sp.]|uniref:hypothetical protein n=1 Tax=Ferrovibrio sp. TaxID=1917215 RepID=UPI0035AE6660
MADPVTTAVTILQMLQQVMAYLPAQPTPEQADRARASLSQARSIADVGASILGCYHRTGRFRSVDVLEVPWQRGQQYNAKTSALLRIDWNGALTQAPYVMIVGIAERDGMVITAIQTDNAMVPPSAKCPLAQWTKAN